MGNQPHQQAQDFDPDESEIDQANVPGAADEDPEEDDAPIVLTKKELAAFENRILSKAQSHADRVSNNVERRFQSLMADNQRTLATMKSMGMTDQQLQDAAQRLQTEAMTRAIRGDAPAGSNSDANNGQPDPQVVNQTAIQIANEGGLLSNDPEIALINNRGSAQEYLASVRAAVGAKQLRLQREGERPASPARMPSLGSGNRPAKKDFSKTSLSEGIEDEIRKYQSRR